VVSAPNLQGRRGGGRSRRLQLLDGAFFSSILGLTTFERSRDFDVDDVSPAELHDTDLRLAMRFVTEIGGNVHAATVRRGRREFVG
jgi:hypothetical protein